MKKLHKSKLAIAIIACTAAMALYENSYAQQGYFSQGQFGRMGGVEIRTTETNYYGNTTWGNCHNKLLNDKAGSLLIPFFAI